MKNKKIAVFRALKLGDLICSTPAFRALRTAFPHAEITLIGLPWAENFVKRYFNYFDKFITFPGFPGLPEQPYNLKDIIRFINFVQKKKFDLIIQMQGKGTIVNHLIQELGAKITAGFYPANQKEEYCFDDDTYIPYPEGEHEILKHLKLMEFLGIKSRGVEVEFPIYQKDIELLLSLPDFRDAAKNEYICIHPGSMSARRWPEKKFAAVADALYKEGFKIVITGTKPEIPIADAVIYYMHHPVINYVGKLDLGTLGALIKNSTLLVSNDTGVSHIAAATHTPSLVVFTTSNPNEWAPLDHNLHISILEKEAQNMDKVLFEVKHLLRKHTQHSSENNYRYLQSYPM